MFKNIHQCCCIDHKCNYRSKDKQYNTICLNLFNTNCMFIIRLLVMFIPIIYQKKGGKSIVQ